MSPVRPQRPRFYEQQYLGARDLSAVVDYARMALARHALGGHVWGIAAGLDLVERTGSGGNLEVAVQPGFAWDGFGRPLWVDRPTTISPALFSRILFDAAEDGGTPAGRLVDVWLAADFTATGEAAPGFEACGSDGTAARVAEGFRILVGARPNHEDRHDGVTVADTTADAEQIHRQLSGDPVTPLLADESVPEQAFPADWDGARWVVPLGAVRWLPSQNPAQPGGFAARDAGDQEQSERRRRYIGVVADTVDAAHGRIRLRSRAAGMDPAVWSDDLVWVEGSLRVGGPLRMLGAAIELRQADGSDGPGPLRIRGDGTDITIETGGALRVDGALLLLDHALELREADGGEGAAPLRILRDGTDLVLHTGSLAAGVPPAGTARVVIGPFVAGAPQPAIVLRDDGRVGIRTATPDRPLAIEAEGGAEELISFVDSAGATRWHLNQRLGGNPGLNLAETGIADGRLYVQAGGNVGIGTTAPTNRLHVEGGTGLRVGRLYLGGGPGWASLAFNAHHDAANANWVFPDASRAAITIELDDSGPRFEVWSSRLGSTQAFRKLLRIDGDSGDGSLAQPLARLGIGTENPAARLDIRVPATAAPVGAVAIDVTSFSTMANAASSYFLRARDLLAPSTPFIVRGDGNVGIGTGTPLTRLHVVGGGTGSVVAAQHTAIFENPTLDSGADVLALKLRTPLLRESNNWVTFYANDNAVGAIEGGMSGADPRVVFSSASADYAEWLPREDGEPALEPGDVVGVHGGRIARRTAGADHMLVVSTAPIVAGNRPPDGERAAHAPVTLLGQVPVKVRGPVRAGDALIANSDDGVAEARAWGELTPADHRRRVAVAWESSDEPGVHRVLAGVGMDSSPALSVLAAAVAELQETVRAMTIVKGT